MSFLDPSLKLQPQTWNQCTLSVSHSLCQSSSQLETVPSMPAPWHVTPGLLKFCFPFKFSRKLSLINFQNQELSFMIDSRGGKLLFFSFSEVYTLFSRLHSGEVGQDLEQILCLLKLLGSWLLVELEGKSQRYVLGCARSRKKITLIVLRQSHVIELLI